MACHARGRLTVFGYMSASASCGHMAIWDYVREVPTADANSRISRTIAAPGPLALGTINAALGELRPQLRLAVELAFHLRPMNISLGISLHFQPRSPEP
jgi:hypothetical protein